VRKYIDVQCNRSLVKYSFRRQICRAWHFSQRNTKNALL